MTLAPSPPVSPLADARREIGRCAVSPTWFIHHHCWIYDPSGDWLPFHLWPAQAEAVHAATNNKLVIWLKARQLGMTWLALGIAMHALLFTAGATVLLFSRRDDEAMDLLKRLTGMYDRLPPWMKCRRKQCSGHQFSLSNGSRALAFPTTAGDSYSATLAIVDEADLVPDLDKLLGSVKPTIDAGGQLILLSRVDKSKPQSPFKRIYRGAVQGENSYCPVFLPWNARPGRTKEWYEEQRRDSESRTGSLDSLFEQYPETAAQALAPRMLDKRIAPAWLFACHKDQKPMTDAEIMAAVKAIKLPTPAASEPPDPSKPEKKPTPIVVPAIPGLHIFRVPKPGERFVVGGDPAEGNPQSDDSALCVLDADTGEQVAELAGKIEPTIFAGHIEKVGVFYNHAPAMVERNNHGHAVLAALRGGRIRILYGHDKHLGWLSSGKGKSLLYDACADAFRNGEVIVHSFKAFTQLASIEGASLRAPDGENDDCADAFALAVAGIPQATREWKLETF